MHRVRHIPKPAALLFHIVAMLTLLLYGSYRLYLGDWMLVAIYGLSLLPLGLSFSKELKGVSSPFNRRVTLLMVSIGIAATSLEIGYAGLIFIFPTVFIYFFLFPITEAFVLSMLFGALALACGAQIEPVDVIVRFAVAGVNCVIFGAVFAYIVSNQRNALVTMAVTDTLTGLFNRKKLTGDLEEMTLGPGAALMLIDVDHFKRINDEAGHQEGDRVLAEMGRLIRASMPANALAYRFGGEEFLLLFPDPLLAQATCQKLQIGLKRLALPDCLQGKVPPVQHPPRQAANDEAESDLIAQKQSVTCSMGLAFKEPAEDIESWLKRADAALYRAKDEGRNRLCLAESSVTYKPFAPEPSASEPSTAAIASGLEPALGADRVQSR